MANYNLDSVNQSPNLPRQRTIDPKSIAIGALVGDLHHGHTYSQHS